MKNFTFKTIKPTGKWCSFYNNEIIIKLDKKECGNIQDTKPHTIRFMVTKSDILEDVNKNCSWKWIKLKNEFNSVDEAKNFITVNFEQLSKLNLRFSE